MKPDNHYEEYLITNATIQFKLKEEKEGKTHKAAVKLGCTGSLNVETEFKEVVKNCEGSASKKWAKPVGMNGTFVGHIAVGVLREAFGFTNDQLKKGVHAYGEDSVAGNGIFTWETLDIEETEKKFLAFPNGTFTGGFKINIENGADEIAQVEMPINFMKDENRKFMYDAFESDLEDEDVKTKWMNEFNLDLIRDTAPSGDEANTRKTNTVETVTNKTEK